MTSDKEETILWKRASEAQKRACFRKQPQFLDFLDLGEQQVVERLPQEPETKLLFYGGFLDAERKMAGFFPAEAFEPEELFRHFPICILQILPKNPKFAQKLSHRDYLGAVMNLGIERAMTGDILVTEAGAYTEALIFTTNKMTQILQNELCKVRNTPVSCRLLNPEELTDCIQRPKEEMKLSVSSERIDAIVGHVFRLSRSQAGELLRAERVCKNSRIVTAPDKILVSGDIISVRGYGKFCYEGTCGQSKKGNRIVKVSKYI